MDTAPLPPAAVPGKIQGFWLDDLTNVPPDGGASAGSDPTTAHNLTNGQ